MTFLDTSVIIDYLQGVDTVVSFVDGQDTLLTSTICVYEVLEGEVFGPGSTDVIGRSLDGIVEVSRNDDNWRAVVEIIERRSVPDTQDILGQYEIELDESGEVIGYRRLEKYRRADTGPSQH